MNLIGISINHKTSPIEIREELHLSREEIIDLIPKLKSSLLSEGVIISTCNRTEIFGIPSGKSITADALIEFLISSKPVLNISPDHFNRFFSCGAVKHLFSVSSGIDSLIIGDAQILGQVKESFEISEQMDFAGTILRRIFDTSIKVGKRSISETLIGDGAVTVSYAAVQVVEKIFATLSNKNALVIGAGETGELAAVNLRDKGIGSISITNRTIERAERLAEKIHGEIIPFQFLKEHLHKFDIIISATSAPNYLISFNDVKAAMNKRKGSTMVLMDIAVPRDIDPKVKNLDAVFYNDMDSLKIIVDQNMLKRREQIPVVERLIMEEMTNFFSWFNSLDVVPTIKSMRNFFEDIRKDELDKIKNKISTDDYQKVEDMTRRLIGRILHNPTIKLREYAETGEHEKEVSANTAVLKDLFNLKNIQSNGFTNEELSGDFKNEKE